MARKGQVDALYLVVETKGYDQFLEIPERERWKMRSAEGFFAALKEKGVDVHFKPKINNQTLAELLLQIDPSAGSA